MPGSSTWSLSLRFPHQNPEYTSSLPIHATCPAHLILLDFNTRKTLSENRTLSSSLCSFLHSPVTSSHLGPNFLLSTLFSNTLSLRSSLSVAPKFHSHTKQQAKLYFCVSQSLNFWIENWKTKDSLFHIEIISLWIS